jgi:hypothetical protein
MDPSQVAAVPLEPVQMSVLASKLRDPFPGIDIEPASNEALENQTRARGEIASIFELKDNRAFQWFETEFIDKPYQEAFEALRSPYTKAADLAVVQLTYVTLRKIKVGLIEREIAHREQLDPNDALIPQLRERLSKM